MPSIIFHLTEAKLITQFLTDQQSLHLLITRLPIYTDGRTISPSEVSCPMPFHVH